MIARRLEIDGNCVCQRTQCRYQARELLRYSIARHDNDSGRIRGNKYYTLEDIFEARGTTRYKIIKKSPQQKTIYLFFSSIEKRWIF